MKTTLILALVAALLAGCGLYTGVAAEKAVIQDTVISEESTVSADTAGTYDADEAQALSADGDLTITEAGTYTLTGTYKNQMIVIDAGDEDEVQLVLENATLINENGPAIYVRNADKVIITAADGTENVISDGSSYSVSDGDTELDAAVFSRDDLVINGSGKLTITGNYKHAVAANDDLKVTAGNITVSAKKDGFHVNEKAEISGGTVSITANEGIEATYVLISGGDITITATDDGINAAQKSDSGTPAVEITGGSLTITMGAGDTDGVDSNGDLIISGGTISVNANSAFDWDGSLSFTGGTVYVNGQQVTTISNQMMDGGMGQPGGFGGMDGQNGFGQNGHGMGGFGGFGGMRP